jgi:hypothetical protein
MVFNRIIVFGCSFAQGDCMEEEGKNLPHHTFIRQTSASLYHEVIYETQSGGSSDRMYRKFFDWIASCKNNIDLSNTLMVFGWTGKTRFEFYDDLSSKWRHISIPGGIEGQRGFDQAEHNTNDWMEEHRILWNNHIDSTYRFMNLKEKEKDVERKIISVESVCKQMNIPYVMFDSLDNTNLDLLDKTHWINWDGKFSSWDDMNESNSELYKGWDDSHPSKESHKEWGRLLDLKVKELY